MAWFIITSVIASGIPLFHYLIKWPQEIILSATNGPVVTATGSWDFMMHFNETFEDECPHCKTVPFINHEIGVLNNKESMMGKDTQF